MTAATKIVATILGCASSGGVPRVGGIWGACNPQNPKNRRRRCSLLLTGTTEGIVGSTQVLIDTGCDMREQLLDANVKQLDAVFYTHEHADHTHGIDDLRAFAIAMQRRIDVYYDARTASRMKNAFKYCFEAPAGSPYPPILNGKLIEAYEPTTILGEGGDITLHPLLQQHGQITSLGYRIENLMYSCDLSDIPSKTLQHLEGLKTWIVDALRPTPHPSHFSFPQALEWIDRVKPETAILTNLHIDLDHDWVNANSADHVCAAYDGMQIDCKTGVKHATT